MEYLLRIGAAGADWYWIMTGRRSADVLDGPTSEMADAFTVLDAEAKQALLLIARRMHSDTNTTLSATINAVAGAMHEPDGDYRGDGE